MSIRLMAEVWTRDLPHPDQAILLALADHADDEGGSVFPSVKLVAWKTGYSTRQVQRIIRDLESRGALILVAAAVRYRANEYRIDLEAVPMKAPFRDRDDTVSPLADSGMTSTPPGMTQPGRPRDDIALSPRTITEPSEEPSDKGGPSGADQEDIDALPDRPAPNPNDRQVYFIGRLIDHDEGWKALTFGGIVSLNKKFGRPTVTEALGRMWEEAQSGAEVPKAPFALVREVCSQIALVSA